MRPSSLRTFAFIGSFALASLLAGALAFLPSPGRGRQAELFALLAFALLVAIGSGAASMRRPKSTTR